MYLDITVGSSLGTPTLYQAVTTGAADFTHPGKETPELRKIRREKEEGEREI